MLDYGLHYHGERFVNLQSNLISPSDHMEAAKQPSVVALMVELDSISHSGDGREALQHSSRRF